MILALPAVTPVTTPELLTVAMAVLELDQVPPPVVLVKVMVLPIQTLFAPVVELTAGRALTVKLAVLAAGTVLQPTDAIWVAVMFVGPKLLNTDVIKVPVPAVNIIEAVFPVDVFEPLKS
jgi:hypothetical protein